MGRNGVIPLFAAAAGTIAAALVSAAMGWAQPSRPALLPPDEDGPFRAFSTAYRGADYRLTVWANGAALLAFDDGPQSQIRLVADISTGPSASSASGLMTAGEVITSGDSERTPLHAFVFLMPNLERVKGSPARFMIVRRDGAMIRDDRICHPIVGNGAWEAYPCI